MHVGSMRDPLRVAHFHFGGFERIFQSKIQSERLVEILIGMACGNEGGVV